jgi:hypothetical protein
VKTEIFSRFGWVFDQESVSDDIVVPLSSPREGPNTRLSTSGESDELTAFHRVIKSSKSRMENRNSFQMVVLFSAEHYYFKLRFWMCRGLEQFLNYYLSNYRSCAIFT